jgi:hemolysin type calcium-binding protein
VVLTKSLRLFTVVVATALLGALALAPSSRASSCNYAGPPVYAAAVSADNQVNVGNDGAGNINFEIGTPCGAATVNNTNAVFITSDLTGTCCVIIELTDGLLQPGFTAEGSGVSEIEIAANDTGSSLDDQLNISAGALPDNIQLGAGGVNFNGDNDYDDLTISGYEKVQIFPREGVDVVNGSGTGAGGTPIAVPLDVQDGSSNVETDTLTGGSANDSISGAAGNDVVRGGFGDDTLRGDSNEAAGNDTIEGGPNSVVGDTLRYDGDGTAVTVNLALTGPQNTGSGGGAGTDSIVDVENIRATGQNDSLTGNSLANTLQGSFGVDTLQGAGGNDTLVGVTFEFSQLQGDTSSYSLAPGGVSVNLSISGPQNTGSAGFDTLIDIQNLTGGAFGDSLIGDGNANALSGGGGGDVLGGGAGNDPLAGGEGNDTMNGGDGNDPLSGDGGNDILGGDAGNDPLDGGAGNDVMTGGAGSDGLTGAAGNDVMTGGTGRDSFSAGAGNDKINSRDGIRERINCGSGKKDKVKADRKDKVKRNCEKVKRK